jgi:hypothetical protein
MAVITTPSGYILYHYIPSKPGAIVVAALFALGTLAVLWRCITTRTKFAIPFMVGGVCKYIEPCVPHMIPNHLTARADQGISGSRWVHRTSNRKRHRGLAPRSVRHPKRSPSRRARLVCCLYLYDPWTSHSERPRRTALYHPTDVTHTSLRPHRHRIILYASGWWRSSSKQELQQKDCRVHHTGRANSANSGVRSVLRNGSDLACAHEAIPYWCVYGG